MADLLTLSEAAKTLHDAVKESALRKARGEGRLAVYRIGNKDYTTPAALQEMLDQCRIHPKVLVSTSESEKVGPASTSSATQAAPKSALAAARHSIAKLKGTSPPTSPRNTTARPNNVTPLKRGSQT